MLSPSLLRQRRRSVLALISTRSIYYLDISNLTVVVFSPNTSVGKTLISIGLANSVLSDIRPSPSTFLYLKPLQTGFPSDYDSSFVFCKVTDLFGLCSPHFLPLFASNHTSRTPTMAQKELFFGSYEGIIVGGQDDEAEDTRIIRRRRLACKTVFGWREAVSPHLAEERECLGRVVDDLAVLEVAATCLEEWNGGEKERVWRVIGGIASPGPSGTLQCDLYSFSFVGSIINTMLSLQVDPDSHYTRFLQRGSIDVLLLPSIPEDPSDNLIN